MDPIPANADEHKAAFQAVAKALLSHGLPVQLRQEGGNRDSGQTDVTRLCYLVGDPQRFYQWPAPRPVTWERSSLPGAHPPPPHGHPVDGEWVPEALDAIDPSSLPYEDWVLVGMVLHDGESKGESAPGLALWKNWSRKDSRYQPNDCSRRWAGFKAGGGVTLGTLRQMARSHGWQDPHPREPRNSAPPLDGESGRPTIQLPHGTLEEEQLNKLKSDEGTLQYVDDCERWMIRYARPIMIETYGTTDGGTSQRPYLLDHRGIWTRDKGALYESFQATVRGYAAATFDSDVKVRRHFRALLKGKEGQAIANAGAVAQHWKSIEHCSRPELTEAESRQLDAKGRYLGCRNGVVDLETGGLLECSDARKHLVTRSTEISYDPSARHNAVDQLTNHLNPEVAEYLWEVLGRALWGTPDKHFIFLLGPRDSGKTTLALAIRKALGEEAGEFSSDALRSERGRNKVGPTPERRALVEHRIVIGSEAEDWRISPAKLKTFSGGGDRITYQPKYQAERTSIVKATIILIANKLPRLGLGDRAVVERFRAIPYERPENRDPAIKDAFREEGDTLAAQAMLAKLVRFARISPPGAMLAIPPGVEAEIKKSAGEEKGPVGVWLDAVLIETESDYDRVSTTELWERWANFNGEADQTSESIGGITRREATMALKEKLQYGSLEMVRYNKRVSRGVKRCRLRSPEEVSEKLAILLGDQGSAGGPQIR